MRHNSSSNHNIVYLQFCVHTNGLERGPCRSFAAVLLLLAVGLLLNRVNTGDIVQVCNCIAHWSQYLFTSGSNNYVASE